ncbi:hypothetical protein BSP99_14925 [Corynebacterium glutamicum]|uniref:Uncharacterized protein n=1 Tax=Corynebacterium glutamicum (strain ATCC 13032 / DSM 20300 / JCM 1318 / BCRC 11384 / CCUG 27702 / LMG 3730 / NBRC 12168 / NCIMB 10025 / NRRL B-2784 / 534) TaxID=196627 RepID=Q8NLJ2_CORGL|nr:hypothetical protein AC079_14665 [Corynebacterium glutamicum]CAF20975.1 hypothetical protein predicted by Glimmer [Corynebacterium glutamicum ATCC 13032]CCH26069.1 hypothetical protein WA5_2849 [Corynebacterium glutamicum K051]AMA01340.1 hypothetical protein APT58_14500 [Corynebacterium glutamicum]ANE09560.1 hypothetical protein A3654_15015 [Corynebacterium glutamicum]
MKNHFCARKQITESDSLLRTRVYAKLHSAERSFEKMGDGSGSSSGVKVVRP